MVFKNWREVVEDRVVLSYIKISFHVIFLSIILGYWVDAIFRLLNKDLLFFFTCDASENLVSVLVAYFIYFRIKKLKELLTVFNLTMIVGLLFVLASIAVLKEYRVSMMFSTTGEIEWTESIFTLQSYIGRSFLTYVFVYIIEHLHFLFSNPYTEAKASLREAEMQLLRHKFAPHFLFNAFNSIYSMSLQQHPQTSDTILKLSGMMRFLTDDIVKSKVVLAQELKFIQEYIAIEKVRFGEQADIQFSVTGDDREVFIEPLLLIVFVENAFKHGFYTNHKTAYVHIKVVVDKGTLYFSVKNRIQQEKYQLDDKRAGKGLENVKKRLNLYYPQKSKLEITQLEDVYAVKLSIEL